VTTGGQFTTRAPRDFGSVDGRADLREEPMRLAEVQLVSCAIVSTRGQLSALDIGKGS
jgi:hypothetical protein